jgi:hypothetical protein
MVGRRVTVRPALLLGTRKREIPASALCPVAVRAATTSASAVWASWTKSLVPLRA